MALATTYDCHFFGKLAKTTPLEIYGAYLSDVAGNLTHSSQEFQCSHPFFRTQSCFPREVVKVCDQPLEDVGETRI